MASSNATNISSQLAPLGVTGAEFNVNGNDVTLATAISGSGQFQKTYAGKLHSLRCQHL